MIDATSRHEASARHDVPSRQVYNAILRQYPADVFGRFRAGGNLYATTIHILVSAVIKVARSTKLPTGLELFRGLGGLMALPDSFFSVDANGCRGYAEWGFLSTTSNRAVAVEVPPCTRALHCHKSLQQSATSSGRFSSRPVCRQLSPPPP